MSLKTYKRRRQRNDSQSNDDSFESEWNQIDESSQGSFDEAKVSIFRKSKLNKDNSELGVSEFRMPTSVCGARVDGIGANLDSSNNMTKPTEETTGIMSQSPLRISHETGATITRKKGNFLAVQQMEQKTQNEGSFVSNSITLLETLESGEMAEHVDEANFALDGLKPGQPLRILRASMATMADLCSCSAKQRILRNHGIVRSMLECALSLPVHEDKGLAMATTAVLYFLASNDQNKAILSSPKVIPFILKFLTQEYSVLQPQDFPNSSQVNHKANHQEKSSRAKSSQRKSSSNNRTTEKSPNLLESRIRKLFSPHAQNLDCPECQICPQLLSILTLHKLCSASVEIHDTSDTKPEGGSFLEIYPTLAACNGLQLVADLAISCLLQIQAADGPSRALLASLQVLENLTFLGHGCQAALVQTEVGWGGERRPFLVFLFEGIKALTELGGSAAGKGGPRKPSKSRKSSEVRRGSSVFDFVDQSGDFQPRKKTAKKSTIAANEALPAGINATSAEGLKSLVADCLTSAVKVAMNLTNESREGCRQVAEFQGTAVVAELAFSRFCQLSSQAVALPVREAEESLMLSLGLLVNLVENNHQNCASLALLELDQSQGATWQGGRPVAALDFFCRLLASQERFPEGCGPREAEEKRAEEMMVEAYAALLLAFLAKLGGSVRRNVERNLCGEGLGRLVPPLQNFLEFHGSLNAISSASSSIVQNLIDFCSMKISCFFEMQNCEIGGELQVKIYMPFLENGPWLKNITSPLFQLR